MAEKHADCIERIGLNFIRPDVNRPGNHDFVNSGLWLVSQYGELGLRWNRMAFSWPLLQPEKDRFDWTVYDALVDACHERGIKILATIGGHFDKPPVPAWAGASLKEVVDGNPAYFHHFVQACVKRYQGRIDHWEVLNEPHRHHVGLTVIDYVEKILNPSYEIIKEVDAAIKVLPCSYGHLPVIGDKEEFWRKAKGHYDIHNIHIYSHWGYLRPEANTDPEVESAGQFRLLMEKRGEGDKPFWITEIGWFGTCGVAHGFGGYYRRIPGLEEPVKPYYPGKEIIAHPATAREAGLCAAWMRALYPRLLSIQGCEKVFQWTSMDEFEGGYDPEALYGEKQEGSGIREIAMWGLIAGDGTWRASAHALQDILRAVPVSEV